MSGIDSRFAGSIPDIYDRFMVPLLFESYAADLARRMAACGPRHVLETAAGTGVVARAALPLLYREASYVATDLNAALREDAARVRQIDERIPAGRWGMPEDIAAAVAFLVSPDAAYVHGHVLAVDGGWLAR